MRYLAALWIILWVASCAPVQENAAAPIVRNDSVEKPLLQKETTVPSDTALESAWLKSGEFSGIAFEGVSFDSHSHRLMVVDQAGGPGSEFPDAASAGHSRGAIAAVNGGFFTPEGKPLGLVVSSEKTAGTWNSASSLGSAVWHEDSSGRSAISRRETLGRAGAAKMREALQAGPMLVENQHAVSGLDPVKSSMRSIILWDGGYRWWIGQTSPCTLAELANAIVSGQPTAWPTRHAINLDGGRSSEFWISGNIPGGPLSRRPPWNRDVRNFLVLAPR